MEGVKKVSETHQEWWKNGSDSRCDWLQVASDSECCKGLRLECLDWYVHARTCGMPVGAVLRSNPGSLVSGICLFANASGDDWFTGAL